MPDDPTFGSCFVTGGAGFIGSHLVGRLLGAGNRVTVYDNLSSGDRRWLREHEGRAGFTFVRGDILDPELLGRSMAGHDMVWHLAANTDIAAGTTHHDIDLKNCTVGTFNVLEAMRALEIKSLAFPSSSAVYGEPKVTPTREDYGPLFPISPYGAAKLGCEGLVAAYAELHGIRAWMFRFANVVGEHMTHGVIRDFVRKLRANPARLAVLGDGEQIKSFFLVQDCVTGMFHAMTKTEARCDVFNLSARDLTRVKEIARIVIEEMGLAGVRIEYAGGRRGFPGDVPALHISIEKLEALGWSPSHTSDGAVRAAARSAIREATQAPG